MEYLIKNISVVGLEKIEINDVHIKDGKFHNISKKIDKENINMIDGTGLYMLPPFYDSHTHGGYGLDFGPNPLDEKTILNYLDNIPKEGSGSVILSSVTSSISDILKIKDNYKKIKSLDKHNICKGIHLEGPWINSSKKGAHDPLLIKEDVLIEELEKVLDSDIAFLTVAPENKGINEAISHFKNITNFSIGHSNCTLEQARESAKAGAKRVTHLYNAMSGFGNRDLGLANEAFINKNLFVEIITDNKHTTKESSLAAYQAIGSDRIMIISDCWSIKEQPDGDYFLSNTWVTKKVNTVYLRNLPTLAGSAMPINELLQIAFKDFNCSMIDLLKISSYNHFISLNQKPDLINIESPANFCIIDMDINVHYTFLNGEKNMENKKINNINLYIGQNDSEVGIKASSEIINLIRNNPKAILGLATGSSPLSTYKEIVKDYNENRTNWKKIKTFNLDEYIGIPASHEKSYRTFMNENLFDHLNIKTKNTHVPLTSGNIDKNISKFEKKLSKNKVNIQILGIGSNGHIAFNEPGSSFESTTYVTDLTQETIEANSRFFKSIDEVPKKAITMGIKSILKAERIILIAIGKSKSEAVYNLLYNSPPTEQWPCTALQNHPNVTVIIDRDCYDGFKSKIK